ncbi:MBL fold metallo-hydrolase [Profundibacter sp.]
MNITKRTLLQGLLAAPALAAPALILTSAPKAAAQTTPVAHMAQVPGYYRYWVGDIEITALLDGYMAIPHSFIIGYDDAAARESTKKAHHRFTEDQVSFPVNGYVIRTGSELILIDTGAPLAIAPTVGGLVANLRSAGFEPKDITTVLMTHLHVDHIGGLLDKDGNKLFKNASFVCSQAEWNFLHDDAVRMAAPEEFRPVLDLARQFVAPYKDQQNLFTGEKELFTGITSIPLHGHTPGHTGYAIHSQGESLLIWGDVIHLSAMQFAHPDWGVVFDADAEQAKKTRIAMFDRASADQMAVAGMHIDFPGIGYVERSGDTYRYVSAPWMPA